MKLLIGLKVQINEEILRKIFFAILAAKLAGFAVYAALGFPALYQLSDANLFHAVANGMVDKSLWGNFFKLLNNFGLYSRPGLSTLFFLMDCLLIPWLLAKLLTDGNEKMQSIDWVALIYISTYPTLTFFSTDVYREALMATLLLILIHFVKDLMNCTSLQELSGINMWRVAGVLLSIAVLFLLRFYLVVAILIAFIAAYVLDFSKRTWIKLLAYVFALWLADQMGIFDMLKGDYRKPYESAGSHYGVNYSTEAFLVAFIRSFFYSVYGINFSNYFSYIFFVIESIPAMLLTAYIVVNRNFSNRFVNFLIIFFIAYATAWNVGVDALGTAVRYRVFNYLALMIAACLIFKIKQKSLLGRVYI